MDFRLLDFDQQATAFQYLFYGIISVRQKEM